MKRSLSDIVKLLGGHLEGADVAINKLSSLSHAQSGDICFFTDTKYSQALAQSKASAVIIAPQHQHLSPLPKIVVDNPYAYFAQLSSLFNPAKHYPSHIAQSACVATTAVVHKSCYIGENVVIGENCHIAENVVIQANCVIGDDVHIGANTKLDANCVIYYACQIGQYCHIFSGAVIGADGFGYAPQHDQWIKIPHIGRVVIGNHVDIGANTSIDRGALDDTIIGDGVKLDNQIQIGHNCIIGDHTVIAGCVGIAGSAKIGKHCRIGGAAMILGHLEIADRVTISPGTMITRSLLEADTYTALMPFMRHAEWLKMAAGLRKMSNLTDKVSALEKQLQQLNKVTTDKKD